MSDEGVFRFQKICQCDISFYANTTYIPTLFWCQYNQSGSLGQASEHFFQLHDCPKTDQKMSGNSCVYINSDNKTDWYWKLPLTPC